MKLPEPRTAYYVVLNGFFVKKVPDNYHYEDGKFHYELHDEFVGGDIFWEDFAGAFNLAKEVQGKVIKQRTEYYDEVVLDETEKEKEHD